MQKNKTFIKCNVIGNLTGVFLHKVLKIYSCSESRLRVEASEAPLKASYDPRIIANASQLSQKIETCVLYNILRVSQYSNTSLFSWIDSSSCKKSFLINDKQCLVLVRANWFHLIAVYHRLDASRLRWRLRLTASGCRPGPCFLSTIANSCSLQPPTPKDEVSNIRSGARISDCN